MATETQQSKVFSVTDEEIALFLNVLANSFEIQMKGEIKNNKNTFTCRSKPHKISKELVPEPFKIFYLGLNEEWWDFELSFKAKIVQHFSEKHPEELKQTLNKIVIGGRDTALKDNPQSAICIYGTSEKINNLLLKTCRGESTKTKFAAYQISNSTQVTKDSLVNCIFKDASQPQGKMGWKWNRILMSVKHLQQQDKIEDDNNTFILIIFEQWEDDNKKYDITIPGGKRSVGETSKESAIRECFEETGIEIVEDQIQDETTFAEETLVYFVELN